MFELGKEYTREDLNNIYKEASETGYLSKWQFGNTVDKRFFQRFTINNIYSELWETTEDVYICTMTDGKTMNDNSHEKVFTANVMPTDRTKKKDYFTRYKGNKKEDWNPVTTMMGTGKKSWD